MAYRSPQVNPFAFRDCETMYDVIHATVVLLQTGFTQEAGVILRTLYDF